MDARVKTRRSQVRSLSHYERHYTWSHPIADHVMAHKDGAVSCLIEWAGVDAEMMDADDRLRYWPNLYRLLDSLPDGYCLESHLWREHDYSLANEYREKGQDMIRGQAFAGFIREKQADHLSQFARVNSTAMVLVKLPEKSLFSFGVKKKLIEQARAGDELLKTARDLMTHLESPRIANLQEYRKRIQQSIHREAFVNKCFPAFNPQLLMSEQVIPEAPVLDQSSVKLAGYYTRVLYLYLYPDVEPGWFADKLAALPFNYHISHILLSTDTRAQIQQVEREQDLLEGMSSRRGRFTTAKGLRDMSSFQKLVTDQNLSILRNAFVIHLHGDSPEKLEDAIKGFTDCIEKDQNGGALRDNDYLQLPWFRAGQPGQGYRAPMFRPDHTWQVGDMLPVQTYRRGDSNPESLRLGACSQLIGQNFMDEPVAHSFTVAMTGAGKGVDKGTQIIESYPFGMDWYIAEIGQSYRWTVEAFGGTYTSIDPDKDVVNPLPPYSAAEDYDPNVDDLPLNAKIVGGTVEALTFLLTDGDLSLSMHQRSAAQSALQVVYAFPDKNIEAPTLKTFFNVINDEEFQEELLGSQEQREAAKHMASNLFSFLETTEGRLFTRQDNIQFSEGITGIDLNPVLQASKQLMKFYLVFISLRYAQLAYFRPNKSRILLDEMHKFVEIFPEVMKPLIKGVSRMGRKEHGFIDLVTQGITEIDVIEEEVLNSMPLRTLMYRPDGHDDIADRIKMPHGPLNIWKGFPDPTRFDWRPGIRCTRDAYYNLYHTYPPELLAVVDTSDLNCKNRIANETLDPLERIYRFYNREYTA